MKWVVVAVIVLGAIAGLIALVGSRLPPAHEARRQAAFGAPPDAIWAAITDVDRFPTWRSDVKTVARLPDRNGQRVWREDGRSGAITFAVEREEPPRLLVVRIADDTLPFGGTWTYELHPDGAGTALTITERGEIYNPVFRFMARFVFGYEGTIAAYLTSLDKKLRSAARS